jgi:hypothetical protein
MTSRRLVQATFCTGLTLVLAGASTPAQASTDNVVLQWNAAMLEAIRHSTLGPPAVARALAIVHTCIYDAWAVYDPVAIGVHYREKDLTAPTEEKRERAISYAAHRALVDLLPAQRARFDALMAALGYPPDDFTDGDAARGAVAAEAGLAFRATDGANQHANYGDDTGYAPVNTPDDLVDPNRWQPLRLPTGAVQSYLLPHWGRVAPFALTSGHQFRPQPPALYPHGRYRKQALEILHLSARLTDRQKVIASYWEDGPGSETPPGHWCLFAQFVSRRDGHDLEQDVKLFLALANALMDASIAVWEAKSFYDYVRPVTAIRFLFAGQPVRAWGGPLQGPRPIRGDTWQAYITTPPFAEYVSGHSTFSAASAEILRSFTGSDHFGAQVTIPAGASPIEPGLVPREAVTLAWRTFSDAADEAGISRRYGGIHFEDGDLEARAMGRQIGALVWQKAQSYFEGTAPVPSSSRTSHVATREEVGLLGQDGQPVPAPACQVRHDHVAAQVELRLEQDAPATRSSASAVEGTTQGAAQAGTGVRMARARARGGIQLTVENLSDQMIRHGQQILVGCWLPPLIAVSSREDLEPAPGAAV